MAAQRIFAVLLILLPAWSGEATESGSRTVLGSGNQWLSLGAEALRAGEYEEGVRFTLRGLDQFPSPRDRGAGLSNLCAGYTALGEFDLAMEACTEALAINPRNWHAFHNRAVAHIRQNKLEEALRDLEAGLEVNPNSRLMLRAAELTRAELVRARVIMKDSY